MPITRRTFLKLSTAGAAAGLGVLTGHHRLIGAEPSPAAGTPAKVSEPFAYLDPRGNRLHRSFPGPIRAGSRAPGHGVQPRQDPSGRTARGGRAAHRRPQRSARRPQRPPLGRGDRQPDDVARVGARRGPSSQGQRGSLRLHPRRFPSTPTTASLATTRVLRWKSTPAPTR